MIVYFGGEKMASPSQNKEACSERKPSDGEIFWGTFESWAKNNPDIFMESLVNGAQDMVEYLANCNCDPAHEFANSERKKLEREKDKETFA